MTCDSCLCPPIRSPTKWATTGVLNMVMLGAMTAVARRLGHSAGTGRRGAVLAGKKEVSRGPPIASALTKACRNAFQENDIQEKDFP
jgi:hypothetical protein